jgi:hypothetical protein
MWQMYPCPNCRAPVAFGMRFCGNCGMRLIPSSSLTYNYPHPNQQRILCNQKPIGENLNQYRQRYMNSDRSVIPSKKTASVGGTTTPMRTEISKLLAELFEKHTQHNKVQPISK